MRRLNLPALIAAAALALSVYLANLFISTVGQCVAPGGPCLIPVWPGLSAPSGVLWVPVALLLRDYLSERGGRAWVAGAIAAGAALSALLSSALALASALAFAASEAADWGAYSAVRPRWGVVAAVGVSGAVGIVVDSVLFLGLAFGSLDFLAGQVVGKAWGVALGAALVWAWTRRRPAEVAA